MNPTLRQQNPVRVNNTRFLMTFLLVAIQLFVGLGLDSAQAVENKRVGILVDGPYWHNNVFLQQIGKELDKINAGQFNLKYPKEYILNGNYDFNRIKQYALVLANSKKLDAIISIGMISSYVMSQIKPLKIPVVAMDYILPAGLGMLSPQTFKPLNPNWTTSFDPAYVDEALKIFPKLVSANRFVVLCPKVVCGFDARISKLIESFVSNKRVDVKVEIISPKNYVEKINKLDVPLVVVEALKGFTDTEMQDVFERLKARGILAFTVDGIYGIKKGALVSIHDYDVERIGRNMALKILDILSGTPPSEIKVIDFKTAELIFNLETARELKYEIPLEFIDEARLYGAPEKHPDLLFEKAISHALSNNWDVKAQALVQNQALLQKQITERGFYPQLSSLLSYNRSGKDQVDSIGRARGETRLDLTLQQKLYDRELWKSIKSAEANQEIEKENLGLINQDIILQVALAYLDNLQGEELVGIQRNYLNIIRKNQTLADLKFKLRETGKSDVLRLNIELENARIDLMSAKNTRFNAQVRLNALLNLPRESSHNFEDKGFSEEEYSIRANRFRKFLNTANQLKSFRNYFDDQAQENSPDLKVLMASLKQAQIEKDRVVSRFYPNLSMEGGYFNQLQSDTRSMTPAEQQVFNDTFGDGWQFGLQFNLPLYQGGARFKQVEQANIRILELQSRINSLKNSISVDARSGLYNVFRSRRNLEFALRNVRSSKENLKLAEVAYLEGDLPVIDLLDSQSRLILSKTNAVVTRYQFHRDLFNLFRAVGRVELIEKFNDIKMLEQFLNEMELYYSNADSKVNQNPVAVDTP